MAIQPNSSFPPVPLHECSIFTRLLSNSTNDPNFVGNFQASAPVYVDAATEIALTRSALKTLALEFAWALTKVESVGGKKAPRLKRGDVLLIFSDNSLAYPVVMFGAFAAGLCCTLVNIAYTAGELAHQYNDSGAKTVLTTPKYFKVVQEMFNNVLGLKWDDWRSKVVIIPDDFGWVTKDGKSGNPVFNEASESLLRLDDMLGIGSISEEEKLNGSETAFMCYSSGTTGKPKGVETTHQNAVAILDMSFYLAALVPGVDSVLAILPFYHIYGAVFLVLFSVYRGIKCVIMPRFDPEQYCMNVEKFNITMAMVVPPVLVVLSRHPAVDKYDLSSLKWVYSGAAPLGAALQAQVYRLLSKRKPGSTIHVIQGYGLTESTGASHLMPLWFDKPKPGSVGVLLGNLQGRLVDPNHDGEDHLAKDVKEGEPGELWMRGPSIMKGYLNNPTANKNSITADGYFKTGDIAIRDEDGFYYIVNRKKELIKYKGFQVAPAELEGVLLTHPDIADVGVIGIEDIEEATELPRAYIVHANPSKVSTDENRQAFSKSVAKWLENKVARHKYLRGGVVLIDEIPKSASGKILHRHLRDLAKREQPSALKSKL
ncbi:AMP binding protein [Rhodocollybia butyracea]|uniref:AMP binding protein n=1 Tax=Rhodocollybia butyracea TaxID=206335 RepID=A0A9P5UBK2_9AGAR|nr:AMP binding protein [Rhodocollybia butyracea]